LNGLRLQNLGIIVDDRIDVEDIKHQGEYEYMTNIENNSNKKTIEDFFFKMLIKVLAIHELLTKKLF
jgi:hypothetical protein